MTDILNQTLFAQPQKDFEDHLYIPDNDRIIFSGRFGIGKSTFINHFFKKSNNYNFIHIFPVNYSVSPNEDIIKYIKYDIILEMIMRDYPIENLDFSKWHSLPFFLSKNFHKLAATLFYAIPAVGKDIVGFADRVNNFASDFNTEHKANNEQHNENTVFESYLNSVENLDSGLQEFGLETQIIERVLQRKKESDSDKQNVLIIDDLDRIDPEHIFRILNVFAAHFDYQSGFKNKFGFDKIVLVCDIENIRSIFHHRYGSEVDFNGYIDKFYSHEVFEFLNRKAIAKFVKDSLREVKWVSDDFVDPQVEDIKAKLLHDNSFLILFITELTQLGLLNLRNIVKWKGKPFYFEEFVNFDDRQLNIGSHSCLLIMRFLITFFGSKSSLYSTVKKIIPSKFVFNKRVMENFCYQLLALITRQEEADLGTEMLFSYDRITHAAKYEKTDEVCNLIVDHLIPTSQNSKTRQRVQVDAEILKICILKYLDHS